MYFKDNGNGTYSVTHFQASDLLSICKTVKLCEDLRAANADEASNAAAEAINSFSI